MFHDYYFPLGNLSKKYLYIYLRERERERELKCEFIPFRISIKWEWGGPEREALPLSGAGGGGLMKKFFLFDLHRSSIRTKPFPYSMLADR